jgi:cyclophilin family peptidyl-prolyl cis-trans isomerase
LFKTALGFEQMQTDHEGKIAELRRAPKRDIVKNACWRYHKSKMRLPWIVPLLLPCFAWCQPSAPPEDLEAVVATDLGTFRFEFAPDRAPKHVLQFLTLAHQGYYDGSAFFRVVANGIIQGGDPLLKDPKTGRDLWGTGGLNLLAGETSGLKHERGVVSAVRIPNKPNSDGAQFFVCLFPQPALDGQFSAFGRVTEGIDVVERISQAPVGADGLTETPVRILKVAIEKKKMEPFLTATLDEMRKTVTLKTTLGSIKIKMEPDWAPNHVRNFLKLVSTGWYDGTAFHRLAKSFVLQGGMGNTRTGHPTHPADRWVRPLKGEFRDDLKHDRGIVSMAHADDPDSATTSFFLVLGAAPHLDGKYTVFGRVVAVMEVLDAFEKEEVDGETPKRRLELIEATIDHQ